MNETTPPPDLSVSTSTAGAKVAFYKKVQFYAILLPVVFALGIGAGYLLWGRQAKAAVAQNAQATAAAGQQQPVKRYDVPENGNPVYGPDSAPITIIEFSDYECPYCTRWHDEVFLRLREEYGNKVRVVYRDFPLLSIHPESLPAALAADCANEQGAYWKYHDLLFSGGELGRDTYLQYATQLGLNIEQFTQCIDTEKYKDEVMADYQYASDLGVRSTPTFFVNGIAVVGAQPYDVFKQIIDKELAGEIP